MHLAIALSLALTSAPDLTLDVELSADEIESGTALELTARFSNAGPSPLEFFVPEHVGAVSFPRWILRREDGAEYRPYDGPFQSGWKRGVQGEIVTLAPGAARAFTLRRGHVVPAAAEPGADPVPLPPGRYAVRAEYEKVSTLVPWSERAFEVERRVSAGLWTGSVRSPEVALVVRASTAPLLRLEAPATAVVGQGYPVAIELVNEGETALGPRGALTLRVGSKARASGTVRLVLWNEGHSVARPEQVHGVPLAAGARRRVEVDLAELTFLTDAGEPLGLFDVIGGTFHLRAAFVDEAGSALASAGGYRARAALEPGSVDGLELVLEPAGHVRNEPRVTAVLRNAGDAPVHVPAALTWPRHVFFSITRTRAESERRYSVTTCGGLTSELEELSSLALLDGKLSWDGDAYEVSAPYEAQSFVLLPPGGTLRRTFALGQLLPHEGTLSHGEIEVRAYWRNREDGRRLGLEPRLTVGLVESEPVRVRGSGW